MPECGQQCKKYQDHQDPLFASLMLKLTDAKKDGMEGICLSLGRSPAQKLGKSRLPHVVELTDRPGATSKEELQLVRSSWDHLGSSLHVHPQPVLEKIISGYPSFGFVKRRISGFLV
ncbi:hypothetical protein PIB30_005837 [Stylosanthes scabra]|uniref:Uncharacterized protein n=1 Tax=Stylosanthes scabra TaxID=79078 RepID=A0ABU6Z623_9FABA|nr:hypothetical protein [Stylosanthes scabra]